MDNQTRKYLKKKGRNQGRFVALPYNQLESAAWRHLTPEAGFIYIEIKKRYNGANNGEIGLSCREASKVAHCGKGTAGKKPEELIEHGFIKPAIKGRFRNRHASTWILTCEVFEHKSPSNEWKEWMPPKQNGVPMVELHSTCDDTEMLTPHYSVSP